MISANRRSILVTIIATLMIAGTSSVHAEDGYRLWLRYEKVTPAKLRAYSNQITSVVVAGTSATSNVVRAELRLALSGLLGRNVAIDSQGGGRKLIVGTPTTSSIIANANLSAQLAKAGPEGFVISARTIEGHRSIIVAANSDIGTLYGTFHLLRMLQSEQPIDTLAIVQSPKIGIRMLNHWDNLDGSIERGYAGRSLWNWDELPTRVDPRLLDYARANASIGINAVSLNNVNANSKILSSEYLQKVKAIADAFRPYGIRVFLSARFSSPIELDGIKTADPLDTEVGNWWKRKADEIYGIIPDFGGFLVKANSEGQPGPRTYGRDHVDGANMMAAAVKPHGGVVIWRAFVYDMKPGYDRAGAAYENLKPFDGKFADNVILQVKNGPIDFQPREPISPLFGAMPRTNMAPEFQITQEYLGFSNHLVFLANMWREALETDTFAKGRGSTVARVADGSLFGRKLTAIAGVANTGTARNWTGHIFLQANWYAYGRLAWDHSLTSAQIADEWIKMTFTRDAAAVKRIAAIMLNSHDAVVDYMTPMGLHHQMWGGHHYGPAPWWNTYPRDDWNPSYYNKASFAGIGFDRTKTGSGTVDQYFPPLRDQYADIRRCPKKFLLWFHHVPWAHRTKSGRSLWDELAHKYQSGVDRVRVMQSEWASLRGSIDADRHDAVTRKLAIQLRDAIWWKDASLSYFVTFSKMPIPRGVEKPKHSLDHYKTVDLLDERAREGALFDEAHK